MLIIAERINATRKRVGAAFATHDAELIRQEAVRQAEAGADFIDVNAALSPEAELDCMAWAVEVVRDATAKPLAVDTASPAVARAGLALLPRGSAILNSISGESARLEAMLPLAVEFQTRLVALAMDDLGMPASNADRWRAIEKIFAATDAAGIPRERLLIDPLIRPVATNPEHVSQVLQMLGEIRARSGGALSVIGLSNISFGLPSRKLINRTFLAMAAAAGLSAAILDPLDTDIMGTFYAAGCLTGEDEYCMKYIAAHRAAKL
jgi:cobalamin-dependent methionine synthase I